MPSLLMSMNDSSAGSTADHCEAQVGKLANGVPTKTVKISYFTRTASAGAVKYSKKMKNNDQVTEARASLTDGVV